MTQNLGLSLGCCCVPKTNSGTQKVRRAETQSCPLCLNRPTQFLKQFSNFAAQIHLATPDTTTSRKSVGNFTWTQDIRIYDRIYEESLSIAKEQGRCTVFYLSWKFANSLMIMFLSWLMPSERGHITNTSLACNTNWLRVFQKSSSLLLQKE